jgi:LacI family transcriptional regulator
MRGALEIPASAQCAKSVHMRVASGQHAAAAGNTLRHLTKCVGKQCALPGKTGSCGHGGEFVSAFRQHVPPHLIASDPQNIQAGGIGIHTGIILLPAPIHRTRERNLLPKLGKGFIMDNMIANPMDKLTDISGIQPARTCLDDVARVAGVSKATVCRALRGTGRISDATREKIRKLAEEMNYKPDPALSALTRYRWGSRVSGRATYSLALVRVDPIASPSSQKRKSGVAERAAELNFLLEEHQLDSKTSPASLSRILFARGIDGIIFEICGPVFHWDFAWDRFACVTIGFDGEAHQLNSVTSDWFNAVRIASDKARLAGCRRIGYANFFRGNPSMDDRMHAATLLERSRNTQLFGAQPPIFWYPGDRNLTKNVFQEDRDLFLRWVKKYQPDVIVDGNRTAIWWLRDADIKIPEDIRYVTLNARPVDEPGSSGTAHEQKRQARLAVDLLFNLIQVNERGLSNSPLRMTTPCSWHEGETLFVKSKRAAKRKK